MVEKIILKIGEMEIVIGELDRTCKNCIKDIEKLIEFVDNKKIYLYQSTLHGETNWHLEVIP